MKFIHTLDTAKRSLLGRPSRTLLTILGIVIGITAIMLVTAAGKGAQEFINRELAGLGAETLVIRPGKEPKGAVDFTEVLFTESLKKRELDALSRQLDPGKLKDLAPEVFVPGAKVSHGGETYKATVLGFSAEFMRDNLGLSVGTGNTFSQTDIQSQSAVALIGSKVKEELFGAQNALGENITISGKKFRVVGIYEPKGQVVFFNVDDLVLIPYTTAQVYLTGTSHYTQIIVRAKTTSDVEPLREEIKQTLRILHRITDPEDDDFHVDTQQQLVAQVGSIIGIFTLFLSFVVAIALVVGGIGIMNIMLVSVTERTREIGLRKAVGATDRAILFQFLTEAIFLSVLGGIIGILLGATLSYALSFGVSTFTTYKLEFIFPLEGALVGFLASAFVGLIFGIYPARQASKKSPIEALRYE